MFNFVNGLGSDRKVAVVGNNEDLRRSFREYRDELDTEKQIGRYASECGDVTIRRIEDIHATA